VKRGENVAVNPITTALHRNSENSEIHHSDNDLSLLSPKTEGDFTNPSVVVDFGNGEKGIEDLQEGAGYDPHKGLSSAQDCRDTISKIKNKFANGKYKKEATFENALQTWTQKLKEAIAREGLKRGNN
jgi:hypothetical protein